MPKYKYLVKCFKEKQSRIAGKVELTVLEETEETEIETKTKVDPIETNELSVRKILKDKVSDCDYALITDAKSKSEIFISLNPAKGTKETLFPRPARLLAIQLLKRQETMDMEENVVFSRTLIKEDLPVKRKIYLYDGTLKVKDTDENVVAVRVLTDRGVRVMLRSEAGITLPKTKTVQTVARSRTTKKVTRKRKKKARKSKPKKKRRKRRSSKKKR